MSESPDPSDELPAIAGVYVETDRYRRLVGLEREVRAALDALYLARKPEDIAEALRLAAVEEADSSPSLDSARWELYQALSALVEASGWKPPA